MEDDKLEQNTTTENESAKTSEPAKTAEPQGTDWKSEARKWEKRAKENAEKADKWDEREKDAPTLENLQKQVESLKAEAKAAKAEAEHRTLLANVSAATGVPTSLLKGDTEEELKASAEAIAAFAKTSGGGFPADKGGGAPSKPLTKDEIRKIKDPVERVRARAQNIDLYR